MRNLILSSLFLFLVRPFSFAVEMTQEVSKPGDTMEKQWSPVLPVTFHKGLFRMTFDVSKNHISGFLLIKKTSDSSTSIVFSNEFGVCFFYFEVVHGKFLIRNLFPSFNRKSLVSLLEQDFRLILFPDASFKKIKVMPAPDSTIRCFKISARQGSFLYEVIRKTKEITEIRTIYTMFRKTIISPDHYSEGIPWTIRIFHPIQGIMMKISYLSP